MNVSKTHSEIVYRTGGTANCVWRKTIGFPNDKVKAEAADIERMGYKTIIRPAGYTAIIGLPEGWEYKPFS